MLVGETSGHAAARSAVQEADLKQVRLDDLLDRVLFFMKGSAESAETDRATIEFLDDGLQELYITLVEALAVDLHPV